MNHNNLNLIENTQNFTGGKQLALSLITLSIIWIFIQIGVPYLTGYTQFKEDYIKKYGLADACQSYKESTESVKLIWTMCVYKNQKYEYNTATYREVPVEDRLWKIWDSKGRWEIIEERRKIEEQ